MMYVHALCKKMHASKAKMLHYKNKFQMKAIWIKRIF